MKMRKQHCVNPAKLADTDSWGEPHQRPDATENWISHESSTVELHHHGGVPEPRERPIAGHRFLQMSPSLLPRRPWPAGSAPARGRRAPTPGEPLSGAPPGLHRLRRDRSDRGLPAQLLRRSGQPVPGPFGGGGDRAMAARPARGEPPPQPLPPIGLRRLSLGQVRRQEKQRWTRKSVWGLDLILYARIRPSLFRRWKAQDRHPCPRPVRGCRRAAATTIR